MNKSPVYLDYNATAPLRPEVVQVMAEVLSRPSNPSSIHKFGREAKKIVEDTRAGLADFVSCFPQEIVFTGSGTEANNLVLRSFAGLEVWVSAIEHASVLKTVPHACRLPVTPQGELDVAALADLLKGGAGPALVSVMLANNETGVIQPVREVVELCRPLGIKVHCDAVQGLGKIPVDAGLFGVDFMTLAAHKMGGPVGAAALVVRQGSVTLPQITGGGQELNRRAGTENVAALAGWAKALELSKAEIPVEFAPPPSHHWQPRLRGWLNALEARLQESGAEIVGQGAPRLPNTTTLRMPGMKAETQLMHFDLAKIAVSAGSACSSGRIEPSAVMRAMGLDEAASGEVVRVSGGWATQEGDLHAFAESWLALRQRVGLKQTA
jgi:cysteine desulfurase